VYINDYIEARKEFIEKENAEEVSIDKL